jgi:amino acid transporter
MEGMAAVPNDSAEPRLKEGTLGYLSNLVIGVASTAPAYSLAATLGFVTAVAGVGTRAPAVLIVSFIPILFIAAAYKYLNKADPNAGTSFAWGTRAFGPQMGWVMGWAIIAADVIVMATLAQIAGKYTFLLVGWHAAASSTAAQIVAAVIWIALMTWICWRGIELSARLQQILLSFEVVVLAIFAVVVLVKVYGGSAGVHAMHPALSWFNPFGLSTSALADGVLLGVFIYWGWDSGVAVNEESKDKADGPGRAAVMSTLLLVLIYVIVSAAAQAYDGTGLLTNHADDVLSVLGSQAFGSPWDKLLILAVLTSASASTQTTILPTARTTLSMARWGALPKTFARIHPRYLTPDYSTIVMGVVSVIWTVLVLALNPSQNVLGDSISALGFAIAFYYGLTGLAAVVYFRREVTKSVRNFLFAGVVPLAGFALMAALFVKAFHDYSKKGFNYSPPLAGIEVPIAVGIGMLIVGVVLMLVSWIRYPEFFRRRPEVAPPGILEAPVEHAQAHF